MTNLGKTIIWVIIALFIIGGGIYWLSGVETVQEPEPEEPIAADPWESLEYISAVDWPPSVQVVPGPFSCTEAGEETARAGRTESRTIDGRAYCVTTISEGAAGSVYTQYAYATETEGNEVIIFTFSSRAPQCGNYDEPQMSACEAERAGFNPDRILADWVLSVGQ